MDVAAHKLYSAASFVISGKAAKYIICGASKFCAPRHPLGRSPFPFSHFSHFSHFDRTRI